MGKEHDGKWGYKDREIGFSGRLELSKLCHSWMGMHVVFISNIYLFGPNVPNPQDCVQSVD